MQQERVEEPQLQEEQYNRYNIKKIKTTTHQATKILVCLTVTQKRKIPQPHLSGCCLGGLVM
jgi:hypothetical protein